MFATKSPVDGSELDPVEATDAALSVVKQRWQGPIGVYPEADRADYVQRYRDHTVDTKITPANFVRATTPLQECQQQSHHRSANAFPDGQDRELESRANSYHTNHRR